MNTKRDKMFDVVRSAHANVDRLEGIVDIYKRTGKDITGGCNTMYNSLEVGGSISNNCISVYTSTIEAKMNDGSIHSHDVVSVMIDDGTCEDPKQAFLTKNECLKLIRCLATAADLLRD